MKRSALLLLVVLFFLALQVHAQGVPARSSSGVGPSEQRVQKLDAAEFNVLFQDALSAGDTLEQERILRSWKASGQSNANWYAARLNFGFFKARRSMISLTKDAPPGERMAFEDSAGQLAGYIGNTVWYDSLESALALQSIELGIARYPARLDLRFGKAHVLFEMQRWDAFAETLEEAIAYGAHSQHQWLWTDDLPGPPNEAAFLSSIQGYQGRLYNAGNDALLPYMRRIAEAVLRHNPKHLESLSNMAISYLAIGSDLKGLQWLLRAEAVAPYDPIVLNNIAVTYMRLEQTKKSHRLL